MVKTQEQEIMMIMRKVLANIIKDTTPEPGMRHPLSEATIQDIRQCLGLISIREKELMQEQGHDTNEKPYFTDEPGRSKVIPISRIARPKKGPDKDQD